MLHKTDVFERLYLCIKNNFARWHKSWCIGL